MEQIFPGVFRIGGKLATPNPQGGKKVYGEKIFREGGKEFRSWDPFRSKLSAAIMKRITEMPVKPGSSVLYLGAANGTTASHVSDIVGEEGTVFCVEFAPRSMRDLIRVCEMRENMIPILADARQPQEYEEAGNADVIYQDVAQPDQAKILLKNAENFLESGGYAMVAVKAASIDVTKPPEKVYEKFISEIEEGLEVLQKTQLEPYDKDHMFIVSRKR